MTAEANRRLCLDVKRETDAGGRRRMPEWCPGRRPNGPPSNWQGISLWWTKTKNTNWDTKLMSDNFGSNPHPAKAA